jgi:glycosyltransferase involved in cell wall biosynthesis
MSLPTHTTDQASRRPVTAVVTIVAKNYLAQARVLMDSVKAQDPEYLRVVLLVDEVEGRFDPEAEDFAVVLSEDLGIPHSPWFHFKYSVLELSTAVKPFFLSWLFRTYGLQKVIYLDPDIRVYASLRGIGQALDDANIVLTPHLTRELNDDLQPGELQILRAGAYNLGFIAVRAHPEVDAFLAWWQSHLYDHCVVDLTRGLFVDQRWIDLAPGLFSGVRILRDDGYNVAYWNAAHRKLSWQEGRVLVNGKPLYFFHFSGYDPHVPEVLSKHQNRISLQSRDDLRLICDEYRQHLAERGFAVTSRWPYSHARFRNGVAIPDVGRHLLDEAPFLLNEISDPFSDEGFARMLDLWNAPISRSANGGQGVTKLAYRVYRLREDVQAAMPDIFGADHIRFLEWFLSSGTQEHCLSEPLLHGVRAALETARTNAPDASGPVASSGDRDLPVICADLLSRGANDPILRQLNSHSLEGPASINQPATTDGKPSRLTILARYIYESRPDLQRVFPDPQGRDEGAYLAWLLYYGRHSYGLTEEFLAPLRMSLAELRQGLSLSGKLHLDMYAFSMRTAIRVSPITAKLRGFRARGLQTRKSPPRTRTAATLTAPQGPPPPFGVNVHGYFRAEMGVGQSARNGIDAIAAAGIPYTIHNHHAVELSQQDRSVAEFSASADYGVDLYFVNADQTAVVHRELSRTPGRYKIGFWTWELDEFPSEWDGAFHAYDEIWVPSSFCQAAIAARSPVPVVRIPYCVRAPHASKKERADFAIGGDSFVFLSVFDMRSCFDRKNPLAVLRAFKTAFADVTGCELVMKVNHADAAPDKLDLLKAEAAGFNIRLIAETFRHEDVAALINLSDCVVSLHRSEGFGLVLGEAMLMEKPVITTSYSGNLDFTTPNTSFLVTYKLREVGFGNAPYAPHCLWADPCVEDAARQMKIVHDNPRLGRERGQAGRVLMERCFSAAAVGALMDARLRIIEGHR